MKQVTIVVPKGHANLSSITGSFEILTRANAYWQKTGNKPMMEVHMVEPQILLLQRVRDAGKFTGEQGSQIALFAADQNPNFIGMDHGADFHVAEC